MGDKQREDLINVFTRWLDTNPSKGLNPIQCATIAQDYSNQRVIEELGNFLIGYNKPTAESLTDDIKSRINELKQN